MNDYTTNSFYEVIKEKFDELNACLTNISDGLNFTPEITFTTRVAHVLMSNMFDQDKLNCIRVLYTQMAWPERPLSKEQIELMEKIK